jgi:hypothetical protein
MPNGRDPIIVVRVMADREIGEGDMKRIADIPVQQVDDELDRRDGEALLVRAWRRQQLVRLGLHRGLARRFADEVDWHDVAALVERGCPPQLALAIVR